MIPRPASPMISRRRKAVAMTFAACVDALQIIVFPFVVATFGVAMPFEDAIDLVAAIVLIAICGFRWQFLVCFFLEALPGLDLLPTWTAVVFLLPTEQQPVLMRRVTLYHDSPTDKVNASPADPHATLHPPIEIKATVRPT